MLPTSRAGPMANTKAMLIDNKEEANKAEKSDEKEKKKEPADIKSNIPQVTVVQ